jgi:hypothetical protein
VEGIWIPLLLFCFLALCLPIRLLAPWGTATGFSFFLLLPSSRQTFKYGKLADILYQLAQGATATEPRIAFDEPNLHHTLPLLEPWPYASQEYLPLGSAQPMHRGTVQYVLHLAMSAFYLDLIGRGDVSAPLAHFPPLVQPAS